MSVVIEVIEGDASVGRVQLDYFDRRRLGFMLKEMARHVESELSGAELRGALKTLLD